MSSFFFFILEKKKNKFREILFKRYLKRWYCNSLWRSTATLEMGSFFTAMLYSTIQKLGGDPMTTIYPMMQSYWHNKSRNFNPVRVTLSTVLWVRVFWRTILGTLKNSYFAWINCCVWWVGLLMHPLLARLNASIHCNWTITSMFT